jgi:hypothetical protein
MYFVPFKALVLKHWSSVRLRGLPPASQLDGINFPVSPTHALNSKQHEKQF